MAEGRRERAAVLRWTIPEPLAVCETQGLAKIIGADPTVPFSFLPSADLNDMVAIDYDFVPETTHFLQLERPEECIALMLDFLEHRKLA